PTLTSEGWPSCAPPVSLASCASLALRWPKPDGSVERERLSWVGTAGMTFPCVVVGPLLIPQGGRALHMGAPDPGGAAVLSGTHRPKADPQAWVSGSDCGCCVAQSPRDIVVACDACDAPAYLPQCRHNATIRL